MPQYTPVDPSLVAYNPQETTQGLLQALNAVETDRQMRAQRAARAERDLLAGKRIAATEAEYDSILSRLPAQDKDLLAQIAANAQRRPTETDAAIARDTATAMSAVPMARSAVDQANLQGAVARSGLPNVSIAAEAERLGNQGRIDDALISQATLAQRRDAAIDTAAVDAARAGSARSLIPVSVQTAADAAKVASLEAGADYADFETIRQANLEKQRLGNLNLQADIDFKIAQAAEALAGGGLTESQASSLRNSLLEGVAKYDKSPVPGLGKTLEVYIYETTNRDGTRDFGSIDQNPEAEDMIKRRNYLQSKINQITPIDSSQDQPTGNANSGRSGRISIDSSGKVIFTNY